MSTASLEDKFRNVGNLRDALRNSPTGFYVFPVPDEHTNWRDEQNAWMNAAVLFDQSYHMSDVYVSGPDRFRLLAELSINDMENLAPMRAVQMVNCASSGHIIGDAIVFHLPDGTLNIIGKPASGNWITFNAETRDYDVSICHTPRLVEENSGRKDFRLQLQGPNAWPILEACNGGQLPETGAFRMCRFSIGGVEVLGLRHGMADAPGMEFWGPYAAKDTVLETLMTVGEAFGIKRGGGKTYSTAGPQSGWVGSVLPAIYAAKDMQSYRQWLPGDGFEASLSLGGSFIGESIADYYLDPWDLGYHRFIHWDHEFTGRDGLLERAAHAHRRKVWLRWHPDDVLKIMGSHLHGGPRYKHLEVPAAHYATIPYDKVEIGSQPVGMSVYATYTTHANSWFSIGILNSDEVDYGQEVQITWGEPEGVTGKLTVEPHEQTTIRATVCKTALG